MRVAGRLAGLLERLAVLAFAALVVAVIVGASPWRSAISWASFCYDRCFNPAQLDCHSTRHAARLDIRLAAGLGIARESRDCSSSSSSGSRPPSGRSRTRGVASPITGSLRWPRCLGLGFPPFVGPIIYMFFRPPEYLQDVHERELEIKAMEQRLAQLDQRCPGAGHGSRRRTSCAPYARRASRPRAGPAASRSTPLWQVCPHCAAPPVGTTCSPRSRTSPRLPRAGQRRQLPE